MSEKSILRERNFRTFRLFSQDRELLRRLGEGRPEIPDRHAALLELTAIAEEMEVPQKEKRQPIRVGIPPGLMNTVTRRAEESGNTFQDVLLMAARIYRERFPLPESEPE
tara:strand:- start:203 stop:532 length:330 start_codon:yes stop_codon:yes gene_type:complete